MVIGMDATAPTVGNISGLTQLELKIMHQVIKHGANKQAAKELGLTLKSVEYRLISIKRKLGAPHTVAAAVIFDRQIRGSQWAGSISEPAGVEAVA